jgi:hypothetical protein
MTTQHVVVVGSGPSAVHFAAGLLERGIAVHMLDVGRERPEPVLPEASFLQLKERLEDPVEYFLGSDFEAVPRQVMNGVGTPVHAVIKGASCVATTVVGIPLASWAQVAGEPQSSQEETYQAVGRTCGGSYVLGTPSVELPPSE